MAKKMDEDRARRFSMDVVVLKVGDGFIAVTQLGGMNVRGNRTREADAAVRDLFNQLAQTHHLNAGLGIELALEGKTFADLGIEGPTAAALEAGGEG